MSSESEMPFSREAEQSVIGAILINQDAIVTSMEHVTPEAFYMPAHKTVFEIMTQLADENKPVDMTTVTARLQDKKQLEQIGGVSYLAEMASMVPIASNVSYYADIVREKYISRKTMEAARNMFQQARNGENASEVLAQTERKISDLADQAAPKREFTMIRDVSLAAWGVAENRYNFRHVYNGVTGLATGFLDFDRMTSGLQNGDLIIVAARPSMGKTAFALNIAQNVGVRLGETVALFSLEMGQVQLVQRMICAEGQIDANKMRTGNFESTDFERMSMAVSTLADANIAIDDTPGITVADIRAKCRRLKQEKGLGLVVIDYLQLISGNSQKGANRQEEVSEISRGLKLMARELDVPVVALSQLSRAVEQRQDKRPMMSDLRESGAIEQDADIVAFLYRDDYYDKESEKKNIIEIIIAKQRNGPVGTVELAFQKQYNKFTNLDWSA